MFPTRSSQNKAHQPVTFVHTTLRRPPRNKQSGSTQAPSLSPLLYTMGNLFSLVLDKLTLHKGAYTRKRVRDGASAPR